jgi:hypothetical protein
MLEEPNLCLLHYGPILLLVDEILLHTWLHTLGGCRKAWKPAEVLTELHERGSMQSSFLPPPSNHNYKALVSHTKDIVAV